MSPATATASALQCYLARLYELDMAFRVEDFLFTDAALAQSLAGRGSRAMDEALLVKEEPDALNLSLYLEPQLLARLDAACPMQALGETVLDDFWSVLEGVSHFTYLTFKAQHTQGVRGVELELQAEVDKFVVTALLAEEQRRPAERPRLHQRLFEESCVDPSLEGAMRTRYLDAGREAARYCLGLLRRYSGADAPALRRELRRFYRLDHRSKLDFIASRA